jgi:hypothetical protein
MAALLFGFLLVLIAVGAVVLGAAWLAIIPLVIAVAVLAWGALTVASGRTPATELRHVDTSNKPELLGPGGPDDPDR